MDEYDKKYITTLLEAIKTHLVLISKQIQEEEKTKAKILMFVSRMQEALERIPGDQD